LMLKCFLQLSNVIRAQPPEGPHTGMQASVSILKV
jgi:hypothetical protein